MSEVGLRISPGLGCGATSRSAALRALLVPSNDAARVRPATSLSGRCSVTHPTVSVIFSGARRSRASSTSSLDGRLRIGTACSTSTREAVRSRASGGDRLAFALPRERDGCEGTARRRFVASHAMWSWTCCARFQRRTSGRATKGGRIGPGGEWLARQGEKSGFARCCHRVHQRKRDDDRCGEPGPRVRLMGYRTRRISHGRSRRNSAYWISRVYWRCASRAAFVAAVAQGLGRAKAFGCGLMLIRRVG